MITTEKYTQVVSEQAINAAVEAMAANGIEAKVVDTLEAAKDAALDLIPDGAEVFTMTSVPLDETGIAKAINESGKYKSVRN